MYLAYVASYTNDEGVTLLARHEQLIAVCGLTFDDSTRWRRAWFLSEDRGQRTVSMSELEQSCVRILNFS